MTSAKNSADTPVRRLTSFRSKRDQRGQAEIFLLLFYGAAGLVLLVFVLALWLGKGVKGKLLGVCVATALTSPILWPAVRIKLEGNAERKRVDQLRAKFAPICEQELKSTPGPFLVDGFLDETEGGLRGRDLEYFLTEGAMQFVEIKLNESGNINGPEDNANWPAEQRKGYARLRLGDSGNTSCYVRKKSDPDASFFTSYSPVRPGTCLQVSYSDQPSARYRVNLQIDPSDSDLSRWVLTDSSTNKIVAGFTDAFKAMPYSNFPPHIRRDTSDSCAPSGRSGYSTLMQRIQPTEAAVAAASEYLLKKAPLKIDGLPADWVALSTLKESSEMTSIPSTDAPYAGDEKSYQLHRGPTWTESYRLAEQHGVWVAGNLLIRIKEGLVQEIPYNGLSGAWGTTGKELVFAPVTGPVGGLVIFGIGFDGQTRWKAKLSSMTLWKMSFRPEWFELTSEHLMVHGSYGEHSTKWTVTMPLKHLHSLSDAPAK